MTASGHDYFMDIYHISGGKPDPTHKQGSGAQNPQKKDKSLPEP